MSYSFQVGWSRGISRQGQLTKTFMLPFSAQSKKPIPQKWLIPLRQRIPGFQLCSASHGPLFPQKPGSFFATPLASYRAPRHCFSSPSSRQRVCSGHIIKNRRSIINRESLHMPVHICVSPHMQEHLEVSVLSVWNPNTEYEGTKRGRALCKQYWYFRIDFV